MTDSETLEEWTETAADDPGELVEDVSTIAAETERPDAQDRNKAVTALSRIAKDHPEAVADVRPALMERLVDENDVIRYNTGLALERIGRSHPDRLFDVVQPIAERLGDEESDVQGQSGDVLDVVADEYPKAVKDAVATVLDDLRSELDAEDAGDRNAAALGFVHAASVAHEEVVPHTDALVELFTDNALPPRYHATMAVKRIATRDATIVADVVKPLAEQLDDDDEDVRDVAMHALAPIAEARPDDVIHVLDPIGDALRDDHGEVRRYAAQAVAALAETHTNAVEPHVDALVEALARGPDEVSEHASEALHGLASAEPGLVETALEDAGVAVNEDPRAAISAVRNDEVSVPAYADTGGRPEIASLEESAFENSAGAQSVGNTDTTGSLINRLDELLSGETGIGTVRAPVDYEEDNAVRVSTSGDGCAYERTIDRSTWECPHEPTDESNFCVFHAPIDQKDDRAVTEALIDVIKSEGRRVKELIGARFGDVHLSHEVLSAADNHPVDLRYGYVVGNLDCENTTVGQPLQADELTIAGHADFEAATFERELDFNHATFGAATFDKAVFEQEAHFESGTFSGEPSFDRATFEATTNFDRAVFTEKANFREITAAESLFLEHVRFRSGVSFLKLNGGTVHLDNATVDGDLNLRSAQITRKVDISGLSVDADLIFSMTSIERLYGEDVHVGGDFDMLNISVDGQIMLEDNTIRGDFKLNEAELDRLAVIDGTFDGKLILTNTTSHKTIAVRESEIGDNLEISGARCEGKFHLLETTIGNELQGLTARLLGTVIFKDVTITGETDLNRILFERRASFIQTEFGGATSFENGVFRSEAKFREVTFGSETTFEEATFETTLLLRNTTFTAEIDFSDAAITTVQFENTSANDGTTFDFEGTTIAAGVISVSSDRLVYDFEGATLGDVDLEASDDIDGSVLEHFRFHNTTFDGFNFGTHRGELAAANWRIHTTLDGFRFRTAEDDEIIEMLSQADPDDVDVEALAQESSLEREEIRNLLATDDFEQIWHDHGPGGEIPPSQLENTYQKAKEDANSQGLNDIAAEFFLHEKRFKRRRHAQRVRESDTLLGRIRGAFDWISNLTMDVTTGYGERPRNVIVASLLTVGLYTGVYWWLGALADEGSPAEYFLFSLQNFVTFLIGTQPQGTLPVRYASAIEAFLGAFFVALFVFTLTRSLNR